LTKGKWNHWTHFLGLWKCTKSSRASKFLVRWQRHKPNIFKRILIFGDVDKIYKDDVYNAILLNIKYYIYKTNVWRKNYPFIRLKNEKNDCCPKSKNCRISITLEYFWKTVWGLLAYFLFLCKLPFHRDTIKY
jgi:hypothetical protein